MHRSLNAGHPWNYTQSVTDRTRKRDILAKKEGCVKTFQLLAAIQKHPNKDKHSEADKKNPLMIRSRGNRRRPFIAILWGMATFKDGPQVKF